MPPSRAVVMVHAPFVRCWHTYFDAWQAIPLYCTSEYAVSYSQLQLLHAAQSHHREGKPQ